MLSFVVSLGILIVKLDGLMGDGYPVFNADGTYYEVGYQIGTQARMLIQEFYNANMDFNTIKEYIKTKDGLKQYDDLMRYNYKLYADTYFEELRGIADGAQMSLQDILILNFEYELDAFMAMNNYTNNTSNNYYRYTPDSCSNLFINSDQFFGIAHNEDDWNISLNCAYYTNVTYRDSNNNIMNNIFGFNFIPGILTGTSSPAVSLSNSMTLDVNYLFPEIVQYDGKACVFICKDILNSPSMESAIKSISNAAGGASFNIGYKKEHKMANVELYLNKQNVLHINNHNYSYHFNEYLRIDNGNVVSWPLYYPSSESRLNRTIQIINDDYNGSLTTMDEMRYILGDTQNTEYPIYRTTYISTLMTSIFDIQSGNAYFFDKCNPKYCDPTFHVIF